MRADGLGLEDGFARNAGEIAIQGWHVKREWAVPLVKEGQRSRRWEKESGGGDNNIIES